MIDACPDDIRDNEIDRLIKFYRRRLYLKDSQFRILSDIGEDAENLLAYLEAERTALIEKFEREDRGQDPSAIRGFALYHARYSGAGIG